MFSIGRAFVLVALISASLPLVLMWALPHNPDQTSPTDSAQERHLPLARTIGSFLAQYVHSRTLAFNQLADDLLADRPATLTPSLLQGLGLRALVLVDVNSGRTLNAAPGGPSGARKVLSRASIDRLVKSTRNQSGPVTDIRPSRNGTASVHLVRRKGDRAVAAALDPGPIEDLANSNALGSNLHVAIVDSSRRLLASSKQAPVANAPDVSALPPIKLMMQAGGEVQSSHPPAALTEGVASFATVPALGWGVLVWQPGADPIPQTNSLTIGVVLIVVFSLVAAVLIAVAVSRLICTPLDGLMAVARRLVNGERDPGVSTPQQLLPREIQALSSFVNGLARKIAKAQTDEAEARRRAETADRQKSEFFHHTVHELRSPVTSIIGLSQALGQALDESRVPARHVEQAQLIRETSHHLLSLVNDLLDLGRIEAGHYQLTETTLGIDEIINRCFRLLEPAAAHRGISLNANYGRTPPAILADERAMYQVMLNLVANAVRYGRTGGHVNVRVVIHGDGTISIAVADDGRGIAAEDLERVMQPFQRIEHHQDAHEQTRGTGLGLPIVKRLVELHDGRFILSSKVGVGTTALVLLPASRGRMQPAVGVSGRTVAA